MAPSALEGIRPVVGDEMKSKSSTVEEAPLTTEHVHGAEDLTPLQAISHNWESGIVLGGK